MTLLQAVFDETSRSQFFLTTFCCQENISKNQFSENILHHRSKHKKAWRWFLNLSSLKVRSQNKTSQASWTLKFTNWTNLKFFCLLFRIFYQLFSADLVRVRHYWCILHFFSLFLHHSSSSSVVMYRKVTTFNEKHKMCNIQNYTRRRMDGEKENLAGYEWGNMYANSDTSAL